MATICEISLREVTIIRRRFPILCWKNRIRSRFRVHIGDGCQTLGDLDDLGSYSRPHLLRGGGEEKRTDGQGPSAHFNWPLRVSPKDILDTWFILLKNEKSTF